MNQIDNRIAGVLVNVDNLNDLIWRKHVWVVVNAATGSKQQADYAIENFCTFTAIFVLS